MSTKGDPIRLGVFVLGGTLVLAVALYLLGSKRNLFSSTITVEATFHQVSGLRPGNNVRYMGINVGTVEKIIIASDTCVRVEMAIKEDDAPNIRDNAIATLGSDGLMGNKLVNLTPGDSGGKPIVDGTVFGTSVPLDTDVMLRTLDRTNANLADITDEVRILATKLNTPGNAMDLLTDTLLSKDVALALSELRLAATHARSATEGIDLLLRDVRSGKGALGTLVSDPAAERQVRALLENLQHVSDSLEIAMSNFSRFSGALNTSGGLAHTLVVDTAVARDVRGTLTRLDTSAVLLNEDLRALQRNWLFRRYFKEQAKEQEKLEKAAE
jgi:phospholipid/cholesterol/gamma-HCH transport system substrate-binding protein